MEHLTSNLFIALVESVAEMRLQYACRNSLAASIQPAARLPVLDSSQRPQGGEICRAESVTESIGVLARTC